MDDSQADGYYGEQDFKSNEIDLKFLDDDDEKEN